MSTLFCFGLSYSAAAYVEYFGAPFSRIAGTVRGGDKASQISRDGFGGRPAEAFGFGAAKNDKAIAAALSEASLVIVSIPPDENGDIALRRYGESLKAAKNLRAIVYLSTIGVYGDHGGAWVDEMTPAKPVSPRSAERRQAETEWQAFGAAHDIAVAILRLPGIYGPGRNALVDLKSGRARRIVKPGQVFNRIHVRDIAQAIEAAYRRGANGIFNICDDEPAPAQDIVSFAAELLGVMPPPEIPFDTLKETLPPMALSFYGECKRARNARMKDELGVALAYPSYREGLRGLHQSGDFA